MEPWLWRRALREGWSELGGWSREEMEAAEKEIWRGESSEISQLGEWVCDACLEGYLGGGLWRLLGAAQRLRCAVSE